MPKNKLRIDDYLINLGNFETREEVLSYVMAKEIRVGTTYITSAATLIELDENNIAKEEIFIKNQKQFVSRGGLKLQRAIEYFNIDVNDKHCLDIGSSTGGFSDCLLQNGANDVTCVDVNYGQLAWVLRNNKRVKVFERLNIKDADAEEIGAPFDIIVSDVSFISLASLSKKIASFCTKNSIFIGLIKPQFECKKGETKNGIVVDEEIRKRCINEVCDAFKDSGFEIKDVIESPIKGQHGNKEFLMLGFV